MESHTEYDIVEMDCPTPAFRGQKVIDKPGIYDLDENNRLVIVHNAMHDDDVEYVIEQEQKNTRYQPQIRGHTIPRLQICYTNDGKPLFYSGVKHAAVKYPLHAVDIADIMLEVLAESIPDNKFTKLSDGISLIYSKDVGNGGKITAHGDIANLKWAVVAIFSLGQARWIRFRRNDDKEYINVKLRHNSFVYMYGEKFQQQYTHQIDELKSEDEVGDRLSLNIRFEKSD